MTRIAKGKQSGEKWDRVKLDDGMVGYCSQSYLEEVKEPVKVTGLELKEEELVLQVGEKYLVEPLVLPNDANNKKVTFSSSNTEISSIDENGNITAIKDGSCNIKVTTQEGNYEKQFTLTVIPKLEEGAINFEKPLNVIGNQISGVQEKQTVEELLSKITSIYNIEMQNANGKKLNNKDLVGTQSKVIVKDGEKVIIQYNIILYGDVNGDGRINSVDLLVLQRHILEIRKLTGIFLKAGNVDKSGKRPSSVDLLKIQRHILDLYKIVQ